MARKVIIKSSLSWFKIAAAINAQFMNSLPNDDDTKKLTSPDT